MASAADVEAVRARLGRRALADFEVVVRDDDGLPVVVRNAPFLDDGTPMPTRYWLVHPTVRQPIDPLGAPRRGPAAPAGGRPRRPHPPRQPARRRPDAPPPP